MRVNFFTNVSSCQIENKGNGRWVLSSIPVTVDNDVMNGVYYPESENKLGINTYIGRPVTLDHPLDENGNPVSAMSKNGLMEHFSGGAIVAAYNHQGVNYMDVEFKEALLAAQDGGEYYINKLKNKEPIGVSTGLTFIGNEESGVAANGKEYSMTAKGQIGDHLAMLPDNKPPAGGANTFIRFNGENDDQVMAVNTDEWIANMEADDKTKGLFERFFERCKQTFAMREVNSDNNQESNNNEDGSMSLTKEDVTAAVNEALASQVAEAVNAAVEPLNAQITELKTALNAKTDAELDEKAGKVSEILGVDKDDAKAMGMNALDKVLAKNGVVTGTPIATNNESPKAKETGVNLAPWEK
ncbi:hypothetical protein [Vibrio phage LP.1]|nr:hypothetical protein [Vibrio phage LP.1]